MKPTPSGRVRPALALILRPSVSACSVVGGSRAGPPALGPRRRRLSAPSAEPHRSRPASTGLRPTIRRTAADVRSFAFPKRSGPSGWCGPPSPTPTPSGPWWSGRPCRLQHPSRSGPRAGETPTTRAGGSPRPSRSWQGRLDFDPLALGDPGGPRPGPGGPRLGERPPGGGPGRPALATPTSSPVRPGSLWPFRGRWPGSCTGWTPAVPASPRPSCDYRPGQHRPDRGHLHRPVQPGGEGAHLLGVDGPGGLATTWMASTSTTSAIPTPTSTTPRGPWTVSGPGWLPASPRPGWRSSSEAYRLRPSRLSSIPCRAPGRSSGGLRSPSWWSGSTTA